MQIDYIRRNVNEEISEDGGAFIQLVNKNTVGLKSSIEEAKAALFVVGASSMIEGYFVGIMRSVFEGIKEDGHPRTVGDITFYPVCGGQFDLDKGWDPAVNDVRIKARLINGVTLDITEWTFRDVTEGRVAFTIDTVSNGVVSGIVSTDKDAELNGKNLPAKEKLSVFWSCGAKGGEVPSDKFTADVSRITVDKSVFGTLTAADEGKDILFAVKGCYNKATKTAALKYVQPGPTITSVHDGAPSPEDGKIGVGSAIIVEGTNLSDASMKLSYTDAEGAAKETTPAATYADGKLTAPASLWTTLDVDQTKPAKVTVTNGGGNAERTVTFREI